MTWSIALHYSTLPLYTTLHYLSTTSLPDEVDVEGAPLQTQAVEGEVSEVTVVQHLQATLHSAHYMLH